MKLSKTLILIFLITFFVLFVSAVLIKIFSPVKTSNNQQTKEAQTLSLILNSSQSLAKVGDKISISVYITGLNVEKVSAFDIKLNYDKTKLTLNSATAGSFFDKYIKVKWDIKNAWFALAKNPSGNNSQPQISSPILVLEFSTLSTSSSTSISINPESTVYISDIGGVHPDSPSISFSIK